MPQWGLLGTFREVTGRFLQEPPSWCRVRKPETHGPEASFPAMDLREDQHRQVKTCTAGFASAQCRVVHTTAACWQLSPSSLD